jgi:hypothetical protein
MEPTDESSLVAFLGICDRRPACPNSSTFSSVSRPLSSACTSVINSGGSGGASACPDTPGVTGCGACLSKPGSADEAADGDTLSSVLLVPGCAGLNRFNVAPSGMPSLRQRSADEGSYSAASGSIRRAASGGPLCGTPRGSGLLLLETPDGNAGKGIDAPSACLHNHGAFSRLLVVPLFSLEFELLHKDGRK